MRFIKTTLASFIILLTMSSASFAIEAKESFEQFIPNPKVTTKLDYEVWEKILEDIVVFTGPSTRQIAYRPAPTVGTRFIWQHSSPFRLEGNKIPFSAMPDDYLDYIKAYRQDLEALTKIVDISSLPRNEQLAFWFNLHNVTIIEIISENYPIRQPKRIRLGEDKILLHEAKIISVNDTLLSLRDIREKIVYPNWNSPLVIYGFFLGDIGSPSIQNFAFTSKNVYHILTLSATEFINSLRGFDKGRVSKLYQDVAQFYFPNFDSDIRQHLAKYMREDVREELDKADTLIIGRYEHFIADLAGGFGKRGPYSHTISNGQVVNNSQTRAISEYLRELEHKRVILKKKGLSLRGTVIIEDIETEDK